MNKKQRDKINEGNYRKERIDRRNKTVNTFLDTAKADKKSVTKAIHELIDQKALLEAQLRRSEADKLDEVFKLCAVIFKNMLPSYKATQLDLWLSAFKRRFTNSSLKELEKYGNVENLKEKDQLQRAIETIEELEREQAEIYLKAAVMIKGRS